MISHLMFLRTDVVQMKSVTLTLLVFNVSVYQATGSDTQSAYKQLIEAYTFME